MDNDNNGEFAGRPEFGRGDGDTAGKPIDGPDGLTSNVVRITCAIVSFGADESRSAATSATDRERLTGLLYG